MSLSAEIYTIGDFILEKFPESTVHVFQEPSASENNSFVVLLKQESRLSESRTNMLVERQYTITYYGQSIEQVMTTMSRLCHEFMNQYQAIPITNSSKHLHIHSLSFTSSTQTENGLMACTGNMLTQFREFRRLEQYTKMAEIQIFTNE